MKFALIAFLMGVNSISLNRPHERLNTQLTFENGVNRSDVDEMAHDYAKVHAYDEGDIKMIMRLAQDTNNVAKMVHPEESTGLRYEAMKYHGYGTGFDRDPKLVRQAAD